MDDKLAVIEQGIALALSEHGLHLTEATWKRNFEKRTLTLSVKITGELDQQLSLLDGTGQ